MNIDNLSTLIMIKIFLTPFKSKRIKKMINNCKLLIQAIHWMAHKKLFLMLLKHKLMIRVIKKSLNIKIAKIKWNNKDCKKSRIQKMNFRIPVAF